MSAADPHQAQAHPPLGFIGWGPQASALHTLLQGSAPGAARAAFGLEPTLPAGSPPLRTIPTLEGLFAQGEILCLEGGMEALGGYLPKMRLAIAERHLLVLLGGGWRMEELLGQLHDRQVMRCLVLAPGEAGPVLAYHASAHVQPASLQRLFVLLGGHCALVPLRNEAHVELLLGLADLVPAAFQMVTEAMADAMITMGFRREGAMRVITSLLLEAAAPPREGTGGAGGARERALDNPLAAAGITEMESAGLRGMLIKAFRAARAESERNGQDRSSQPLNPS